MLGRKCGVENFRGQETRQLPTYGDVRKNFIFRNTHNIFFLLKPDIRGLACDVQRIDVGTRSFGGRKTN